MTRTLAMCQVPIVCTEVCQTPSTTKAEDMDFCSGRHCVFRGSVYVHYVSVWKGVHTTQQVFVAHSVQYFLVPCFVFSLFFYKYRLLSLNFQNIIYSFTLSFCYGLYSNDNAVKTSQTFHFSDPLQGLTVRTSALTL